MERISGLSFVYELFADTSITATVLEKPSSSGFRDRSGMELRASYTLDTKRATLIHELGHRLMAGFPSGAPSLSCYAQAILIQEQGPLYATFLNHPTGVALLSRRRERLALEYCFLPAHRSMLEGSRLVMSHRNARGGLRQFVADRTRGSSGMAVKRSNAEVADIIEQFLEGTGSRWDWDDFTSLRVAEPELDAIRVRCVELHDAAASPAYCAPEGMKELRQIVERLRTGMPERRR